MGTEDIKEYYLVQGASGTPLKELEKFHLKIKKNKPTPANNISMGISNIKDNTAKKGIKGLGMSEYAFGNENYKAALFGDGITIYYDIEKFKLSPIKVDTKTTIDEGCVTGFTSVGDPWVLAHFETINKSKFYVLST